QILAHDQRLHTIPKKRHGFWRSTGKGLKRYGLRRGQKVLGAMVQFVDQERLHLLMMLSFTDVAGDFGRPNDEALAVAKGRDGEGNVNTVALFSDPHRVVVFDALTAFDLGNDIDFF